MPKFPGGRGSFITLGLAASLGALAVARAASPAASSAAVPSLAEYISAICSVAYHSAPGKIGTIAGLFFGLSFGLAGVGAALLGRLADATSIEFVYQVCAFLPAIGLLTAFLPNLGRPMSPVAARMPAQG